VNRASGDKNQRLAAVVGGGAWGTALAIHLARQGTRVRLWLREAELVERIRERRDNPMYLPGIEIPDAVTPYGELASTVDGAEAVLVVVPSQFARAVYADLAQHLDPDVPVVVAAKGIEIDSLLLPLEVAAEVLGRKQPLAVLSGPSFAREVAQGLPTAVVVAAEDVELSLRLQELLASRDLRVYTNTDPIGVQLSGAIKNVMAIAVGVAEGLGLGTNARAALITRGLAEVTRLVLAQGGQAGSASGLAGLGDLVLTCTGDLSRNLGVGRALGRGSRLEDALAGSRSVAEGVRTARSARDLARRAGIEMPIVEEVYRMLYEDGSPQDGVERLLSRPLGPENSRAGGATE
jgi:glycerol-3-phosphate dehydrogenase (NAD(P)+)